MSDIVDRLNEHAEQAHESGSLGWRDTMNEAADEITRLTAEVDSLTVENKALSDSCKAVVKKYDALTARVAELDAICGEYRNLLKQFVADDGSLDAAEQDAIARAYITQQEQEDDGIAQVEQKVNKGP